MINETKYLGKFIEKKNIAKDTWEYIFELDRKFTFKPGQYVWLALENLKKEDKRGNFRAFSISSIPNENNTITIIRRSSSSGYNETINSLNKGDEVTIHGPFGLSYCLPIEKDIPIIMLSGGTGIAPFLSTIRSSIKEKDGRNISLFTTDSSKERAVYNDELEKYSRENPTFVYRHLDRHISWDDIKDSKDIKNSLIFVCGPQSFIDYVYKELKDKGIFDRQFRFESEYPMHEKDKILANIFTEDGNIVIKPDEPDYIRRRAKLVFELVNSSSHHTIVTDPEGRILFANRAAQQITGFSLSEMRGNTPRLWGGLMSRDFYESLWMSKKTGLSIETEVRNRRKNGEIYYVYAHISCIRDENGEIIGFIGNEEDITTLKEAEQKASENSKRFLELTERIPEMYWITEFQPAEHVVYVSSVFEKLFHMSKDKLIANPRAWVKSVHPEDVNIVVNTFESVIKEKTRKNITFRTVSTEGEIKYIYAQADAILDENMNTKRMVGVARDVTLEKAVDRQKDEFISLASHQLKTPIGAMNWNVEMLLNGDYGKLTEEQKEVLGDVYVLGNRMNELVNGLLNISRIESGSIIIEPSQLDFAKLLNEVTMEMKPRIAKKAHKMILNIQENIEKIPADRKLLRIIFQNFISNAIKYTKDKGRITIDLHQDNENVYFSVANNGDPIPTDDQGKIFGKMFRASNASTQDPDGNGLGLYIVKQIVETAGGKIWFTSKEGQDTVFSCSFPLTGMRPKQGNKNLL